MKKLVCSVAAFALIAGVPVIGYADHSDGHKEKGDAVRDDQAREERQSKHQEHMMKKLDVDEETAKALSEIRKEYQEARKEKASEMKGYMSELKEMLKTEGVTDAAIAAQLAKIKLAHEEMQALRSEMMDDFQEVLGPRKSAEILVKMTQKGDRGEKLQRDDRSISSGKKNRSGDGGNHRYNRDYDKD